MQRWILARLRNRQFFSLHELNAAIAQLLVDLNRRPFKKLPGSRAEAFESIDRRAMMPLPATRYEYAEWIKAKVGADTAAATASRTHGNLRGAEYFRVPSTSTDTENTTADEGDDDSCLSNPPSIH